MNKIDKYANLGAVVLPFAATIAAIALLWNHAVNATDLAIMAVMYLVTAGGITIGYHRLLTHRSFATYKWVEYTFAVLGSLAVQGSVIAWVADHRKHHAHTDKEGDPHSPHVGHGEGVRGVFAGLWHAHTGWLMSEHGRADWRKYAPDLFEDDGMRFINRHFLRWSIATLALPALAGFLLTGTLLGALDRPALGRARPGLLRPPRHLVDQLGLPLHGHPALRDRRRVDATSSGSRSPRSARPGTTTTTRSRARRFRA